MKLDFKREHMDHTPGISSYVLSSWKVIIISGYGDAEDDPKRHYKPAS